MRSSCRDQYHTWSAAAVVTSRKIARRQKRGQRASTSTRKRTESCPWAAARSAHKRSTRGTRMKRSGLKKKYAARTASHTRCNHFIGSSPQVIAEVYTRSGTLRAREEASQGRAS